MHRLGRSETIQARELQCRAHVFEGERVVGAAHPFSRRMVITPAGNMTEHDFHCTSWIKLHCDPRAKNQGRNVTRVTYFARRNLGESTTVNADSVNISPAVQNHSGDDGTR